jgi:hypothetical protein
MTLLQAQVQVPTNPVTCTSCSSDAITFGGVIFILIVYHVLFH